jgi:hypothetical protein
VCQEVELQWHAPVVAYYAKDFGPMATLCRTDLNANCHVVNSDLAIQLSNHAKLIDMFSITLPASLVEEIGRCKNFSQI